MITQKKDYFILTTRPKSDIMEFVTNEWINRGFKIYKMVTFERLTKTKYIINNNFFFSYIHDDYIIDSVVHMGKEFKKSIQPFETIEHILTVYVINKQTKKLVEDTNEILEAFSGMFFEVKDIDKRDCFEIKDEDIYSVTLPLKHRIEQALDTEVVISMDRARTRLIKDNVNQWNLVICDEDTIVPISVPVDIDEYQMVNEDAAFRHYIEERYVKYETTRVDIMMNFHSKVDGYFETHVKEASNIDKKLEVSLKMINCTLKYDDVKGRRMLRFVHYFGQNVIKVYVDKVLVSEMSILP